MFGIFDFAWMQASVRIATSIGFAAVGESVGERSGVWNIGLEGLMLSGALAAVLGSSATGSPWMGVAFAVTVGALVALLFAFFVVTLRADQVVVGVGLNLLAAGLTTYVFRGVFTGRETITVPAFDVLRIPLLSDIPIIGRIAFEQIPLVYLLYVLAPALLLILRSTPWGLAVRAAGEHPESVDSAGVSVARIRYEAQILTGVMAGVGGAVLSIGNLNLFAEGMTSGRGFIAIACVILGRWSPIGALGAALLFAGVDALQFRLQSLGTGIASQIWLALPYVLCLVILAGFGGRTRMPTSLGTPFVREGDRPDD